MKEGISNHLYIVLVIMYVFFIIEIDNDERGVIGDFTTISDIRITNI